MNKINMMRLMMSADKILNGKKEPTDTVVVVDKNGHLDDCILL